MTSSLDRYVELLHGALLTEERPEFRAEIVRSLTVILRERQAFREAASHGETYKATLDISTATLLDSLEK